MNLKKRFDKYNSKKINSFDRWWRKKYNIPFGSEAHKSMNPMDIMFEYYEDMNIFLRDINEKKEFDMDDFFLENKDEENRNKTIKMSEKEIDSEFNDLNLDDF